MSTADIKIDLINKILRIEEPKVIQKLQKLLDLELDTSVFQLTELQKQRLKLSDNDNLLTEEKANQEIDLWLNEK